MTTSMPSHMSGRGAWLPIMMPVSVAETGAIPVSRPTGPGPSAATAEYQRMKATAVTMTAR